MRQLIGRLVIIAIATLAVIALFLYVLDFDRGGVIAGAVVSGTLAAVLAIIQWAR